MLHPRKGRRKKGLHRAAKPAYVENQQPSFAPPAFALSPSGHAPLIPSSLPIQRASTARRWPDRASGPDLVPARRQKENCYLLLLWFGPGFRDRDLPWFCRLRYHMCCSRSRRNAAKDCDLPWFRAGTGTYPGLGVLVFSRKSRVLSGWTAATAGSHRDLPWFSGASAGWAGARPSRLLQWPDQTWPKHRRPAPTGCRWRQTCMT